MTVSSKVTTSEIIKRYLVNCFILTVPVLVWNIALADKLPRVFQPDIFWDKIPPVITYGENISRFVLFGLMFVMPLRIETVQQKNGLILYTFGILLYFSSWLMLIFFPDHMWSKSAAGFFAPAFTPLLWLAGIGFTGGKPFFPFPYHRFIYLLVTVIFLVFHNLHTYLVYSRI